MRNKLGESGFMGAVVVFLALVGIAFVYKAGVDQIFNPYHY